MVASPSSALATALLNQFSQLSVGQVTSGHYELTDRDQDDAAALPHRIECLKDADTKGQDAFARCWNQGAWEGAVARIMRRLLGS
jgi:hypothetical protein